MGRVLIRGLGEGVISRLRRRADGHHRSLEGELREILIAASRQVDVESARTLIDDMRARLAGSPQGDSDAMIREDRDR